MKTVNMHEAKTHLSRLVEDVENGEEIIIARAGKPVARLVPATRDAKPREPGILRGRVDVSDDFDAPLPEDVLTRFYGRRVTRRKRRA